MSGNRFLRIGSFDDVFVITMKMVCLDGGIFSQLVLVERGFRYMTKGENHMMGFRNFVVREVVLDDLPKAEFFQRFGFT